MDKIEQTITTVEIAKMLDNTPHKDILKKLEGRTDKNQKHTKGYLEILAERQMSPSDFFIPSTYKDSSGKENRCYKVTKKGCELLANKFTGEKGVIFTARYINRFHDMEDALQTHMPPAAIQQYMERQQMLMEELVEMNRSISDRLLALETRKEESIGITVSPGSKPFTVAENENATRKRNLNRLVAQMAKACGWTKSFALHRLYKTLEEVLDINMDDCVELHKEEIQEDACAIDTVVAYEQLYTTAIRLCNNTLSRMSVEVQS